MKARNTVRRFTQVSLLGQRTDGKTWTVDLEDKKRLGTVIKPDMGFAISRSFWCTFNSMTQNNYFPTFIWIKISLPRTKMPVGPLWLRGTSALAPTTSLENPDKKLLLRTSSNQPIYSLDRQENTADFKVRGAQQQTRLWRSLEKCSLVVP